MSISELTFFSKMLKIAKINGFSEKTIKLLENDFTNRINDYLRVLNLDSKMENLVKKQLFDFELLN